MSNYITAYQQNGNVVVWEKNEDGTRVSTAVAPPYYFYVPDPGGEFTSIYGDKLRKETFTYREDFDRRVQFFKQRGILLYESDIQPHLKVLTNTYMDVPAPKLNYTLYDIEVDYNLTEGFSSVENPYAPINAVALHHYWLNKSYVIAVPPPSYQSRKAEWDLEIDEIRKTENLELHLVEDEKALLNMFLDLIQDSDVLSGWNSQMFDNPYVAKRIIHNFGQKGLARLEFPGAPIARFRDIEVFGKVRQTIDFTSRIGWDYMELFKKFEVSNRQSFSLEAISNEFLPELPKLEYTGTLYSLYHNNFPHFLRYNYRDTEVLAGFEKKLGYLEVANMLYHMSCGLPSHIFGTIRLADLSIINYCHAAGKIVSDRDESKPDGSIAGAMVLHPQRGMHEWLSSVDVASLYPSAIRTVNISPETLIGQMRGTLTEDDRMKHSAHTAIFEQSTQMVTLDFDPMNPERLSGSETHTGEEWFDILMERGWAISGYGTIFTQKFPGIIPSILSDWFTQRKKYKKLKDQAKRAADKLEEERADKNLIIEQRELCDYYDRLQYIFKIKLNSLYGALTNYNFRFFDLRMGESTTGSGRCILDHMCSFIAQQLDGNYSFVSDSIIYGDSVAGDTKIQISENESVNISELFINIDIELNGKQYYYPTNLNTLTFDPDKFATCYLPIKYIVRHKVQKQMYRVYSGQSYVDVTEDHSLVTYIGGKIVEFKPTDVNDHRLLVLTPGTDFIGIHDFRIEPIDSVEYVYDIEVQQTHTFFANNILVHNTDSCYFKTHAGKSGPDKTVSEIQDIATTIGDYLGKMVNESFPDFCVKSFRVQPEYSKLVQCEREVIGKRGIFVTKKRYVIKVVNLDGYKTNKLKAMGLEMKKTTTPKPIQVFTESVVNMILEGEHSWDQIDDHIIAFRDTFNNDFSVFDIGLPKGVKNVEMYTAEYEKCKAIGEKARLPGHVAASIHYNTALTEFGDKESIPIVSGTKIRLFYLKRPIGRFKSIAVPTDMGKFPDWLVNNEQYAINVAQHESRLIDDILGKIFVVLNREVPTAQSKFNNSLMEW